MSTIAFFPEGAYGPTNNCVGIGDVLRRSGHRVVFIVEESFAGTLEAQGFEERLMRLGPPPETDEEPGQFWKDFIRETAPVFRKPTIEQLGEFIAPTMRALVDGAMYVDDRLREIVDELAPDVIVEDNVCAFAALPASGVSWVRIASCNPAYLYPDEVDYARARPLDGWQNLQASVRSTDEPWELPEPLASGDGPVVYLSLGSLGSGDVALMQSLIDALAPSRHRVIVSMGAQHEALRLADNMIGAEFLPQTSVLPQVDVVITHGGNNTVTESLYFGKPMVLLPLFWDQYDNAQRIAETGFGVRLDTYGHESEELAAAVDGLLEDRALQERLAATSGRLRSAPGTVAVADAIEAVLAAKR